MDGHEIDIAVNDDDASWCSCTCGWSSSKASVKDSSAQYTTHVGELMFITARTPSF